MLNDAVFYKSVFIACGYTDLRKGIEGLATLVKAQYKLDPFQKGVLFLFCGRRSDRIKGLIWEGDGFLLLYKRLEAGAYSWPRSTSEVMSITPEQYKALMQGFDIIARRPVHEVSGKELI